MNNTEERKKFWCDVYIAYVNSSNSTESKGAVNWANRALEEFDKKFPNDGNKSKGL